MFFCTRLHSLVVPRPFQNVVWLLASVAILLSSVVWANCDLGIFLKHRFTIVKTSSQYLLWTFGSFFGQGTRNISPSPFVVINVKTQNAMQRQSPGRETNKEAGHRRKQELCFNVLLFQPQAPTQKCSELRRGCFSAASTSSASLLQPLSQET